MKVLFAVVTAGLLALPAFADENGKPTPKSLALRFVDGSSGLLHYIETYGTGDIVYSGFGFTQNDQIKIEVQTTDATESFIATLVNLRYSTEGAFISSNDISMKHVKFVCQNSMGLFGCVGDLGLAESGRVYNHGGNNSFSENRLMVVSSKRGVLFDAPVFKK